MLTDASPGTRNKLPRARNDLSYSTVLLAQSSMQDKFSSPRSDYRIKDLRSEWDHGMSA